MGTELFQCLHDSLSSWFGRWRILPSNECARNAYVGLKHLRVPEISDSGICAQKWIVNTPPSLNVAPAAVRASSQLPGPLGSATTSVFPTAASSALVKPVTSFPATSTEPSVSLMFLNTIGPWHTAAVGLPAS